MDVGELLSFQPMTPTIGLPPVGGNSSGVGLKRKRRFDDSGLTPDDTIKEKKKQTGLSEEDKARILKMVEDEPEPETLDETTLKKMILQFEKRVYRNQELRIKYADMPEKFMESEVELNDIIQEMHVIATVPDLYHILVELNAVQSLLQLLSHDNTDISIAVVDLLQEMTDVDAVTESDEGANSLLDALIEGQIVAMLVQNMERLDEATKEESDGIHSSMAIVENMTELRPDACVDATQQGLMSWLLKRLKAKLPFDGNKLYCSELLSILLQNHQENRQSLGELEGIDVLLQQLAMYKRHDPATGEEIELMENLFDCLCSALMLPANRERFLKGEGLQLMNLMLREKKMSRTSAIKVLDHAMVGNEGTDNCHKFVDILGLRSIFPLFMKTPKAHKKAGPNRQELEEHIVSVVASLVKNCEGAQRHRLLNKFVESDHEKVDRLMELHFKYLTKVHGMDERIEREKQDLRRQGEDITDDMDEQFYLRRLEAGLFTLQLVDYIMLDICHSGPSSIRQRVMQILNLRGGSIKAIKSIMREYAGSIGDAKDADSQAAEQEKILQLVDRF